MQYLIFILLGCLTFSQDNRATEVMHKVLTIDSLVEVSPDKIQVMVLKKGEYKPIKSDHQQNSQNILETYKILKTNHGDPIYCSIDYISNDKNRHIAYYFEKEGSLIAIKKKFSFFDEKCTDKVLHNSLIDIFDKSVKRVGIVRKLKYSDGKMYVDDPLCDVEVPKIKNKIYKNVDAFIHDKNLPNQ